MVQNQPSDDPEPSPVDIHMTREVQEAAARIGIALHGHPLIGRDRHVGF
jgi:DNA repair protein RadC